MQPIAPTPAQGTAAAPPPVATDLHRQLTTARHDLDRLQALLADACADLLRHFTAATSHLQTEVADTPPAAARQLAGVGQHLAGALTALQFQDLASQLIHHTSNRLRDCAEQVTGAVASPARERRAHTNPVAQAAMVDGSVELF